MRKFRNLANLAMSGPRADSDQSKAIVKSTPMDLIAIAIEKGLDPDKLEKLMILQERWVATQASQAFGVAMSEFQGNCPVIPCSKEVKGKKGFTYKYSPLDKTQKLIQPFLTAQGLSVTYSTKIHSDGYLTAFCKVSHVAGHFEISEFTCPVDKDMAVNDSQRQGSVNSYAKRYALANALNLVFEREDDDGAGGGNKHVITEEQVANIEALITEVAADLARLLKWQGVDSIEAILLSDYRDIVAALESRR